MDRRNAFERMLAEEIEREVGPPLPVDALAVTRAAMTTTHKWRFRTMFGAIASAATVLVFAAGSILLLGQTLGPEEGSPAADEALVADLAAVMSEPYDAATVAALYAPDAVIHETTADMTQRGLDAIGARIRDFEAAGFESVATSAPIRQDDFVAAFHEYGTGGDLSGRALVVYQLKDGKVLNQWVYPAE